MDIQEVFSLLSNPVHPNRENTTLYDNAEMTLNENDITNIFLNRRVEVSSGHFYTKAFTIIQNSNLPTDTKNLYTSMFTDYFMDSDINSTVNLDPDENGYSSGFLNSIQNIGERVNEFYQTIYDSDEDVSQIGFYNLLETDVLVNEKREYPVIIPSSINIQESLLNTPVMSARSKSAGMYADHRSRHIVHLDIMYPDFSAFSETDFSYPSFINLLNMFKFMPVNMINSPILAACFVSQYTFPFFHKTLKSAITEEETGIPYYENNNFKGPDTVSQKMEYLKTLANNSGLKTVDDIKALFQNDDPILNIGLDSIAENIIGTERPFDTNGDVADAVLNEFAANTGGSNISFPVPVSFKSASIQSLSDMPGAILARFAFSICQVPAFPYGSIVYRDREGKPTFDPKDCYWGKEYVKIASKKMQSQVGRDLLHVYGNTYSDNDIVENSEIGHNDIVLSYFDYEKGPFRFDTRKDKYKTESGDQSFVLEKMAGAFNSSSVQIPLLGSKFPTVQYMGLNSNDFQLIFSTTSKALIADFMAIKAQIVDSEKSSSLHNSFAVVQNKLLNSLGVSRVTMKAITIESDGDTPNFYRLIISFGENNIDPTVKDSLSLEKGGMPKINFKLYTEYFYDLYLIWATKNGIGARNIAQESSGRVGWTPGGSSNDPDDTSFITTQTHYSNSSSAAKTFVATFPNATVLANADPSFGQNRYQQFKLSSFKFLKPEYDDKLNKLMLAIGVATPQTVAIAGPNSTRDKGFLGNKNRYQMGLGEVASLFNPTYAIDVNPGTAHNAYYCPVLMGVIRNYVRIKDGKNRPTGSIRFDLGDTNYEIAIINEKTLRRNMHIVLEAMMLGVKNVQNVAGINTSDVEGVRNLQLKKSFLPDFHMVEAVFGKFYESNNSPVYNLTKETVIDTDFANTWRVIFDGTLRNLSPMDEPNQTESLINIPKLQKNRFFNFSNYNIKTSMKDARKYVNIMDWIHANDFVIPKDLWDSIFYVIEQRIYSKGVDIFANSVVMDAVFNNFYELISGYEHMFTFDYKKENDQDITYLDILYSRTQQKAFTASLNFTECLNRKLRTEEDIFQVTDLYPDMFLPTYQELIMTDPVIASAVNDAKEIAKKEGRKSIDIMKEVPLVKQFMKTFAPRYGDFGFLPSFDNEKDFTRTANEISEITSVKMHNNIDPDIFYYRERDKNVLINASKTIKVGDGNEMISTGKSISLDINWSEIHKKAFDALPESEKLSAAKYSDERVLLIIKEAFDKGISTFEDNRDPNGFSNPEAFSFLGGITLTPQKMAEISEVLDALTVSEPEKPYESNDSEEEQEIIKATKRAIRHVEFVDNTGRIIGVLTPTEDGKYSVKPGINHIGQQQTYYSSNNALAIELDDENLEELNNRSLLFNDDLNGSVLKCFPTIRLYFIEEDRKSVFSKDDFYGFSDIIECNISSHIYDNDVCRLKLSNLYGVLSNTVFDNRVATDTTKKINSPLQDPNSVVVSPDNIKADIEKIELIDEDGEAFLSKIMLRPGIHIMVKMGYGNNVNTLHTVFTGEISEVRPGPIVEVVAQGYQTELHSEVGTFFEQDTLETFVSSGVGHGLAAGALAMLIPGVGIPVAAMVAAAAMYYSEGGKKFNFSKIINGILLLNSKRHSQLESNPTPHLGDRVSVDPRYSDMHKSLYGPQTISSARASEIFGFTEGRNYSETQAFNAGENFSWFDSTLENMFFGFEAVNLTRNVYIPYGANAEIVDTNEWLVTTQPTISALREVVRYAPNFICTVVPFEQDATLFIGDPTGPYQYRRSTKLEEKHFGHLSIGNKPQKFDISQSQHMISIIASVNRAAEHVNVMTEQALKNVNPHIDPQDYTNEALVSQPVKMLDENFARYKKLIDDTFIKRIPFGKMDISERVAIDLLAQLFGKVAPKELKRSQSKVYALIERTMLKEHAIDPDFLKRKHNTFFNQQKERALQALYALEDGYYFDYDNSWKTATSKYSLKQPWGFTFGYPINSLQRILGVNFPWLGRNNWNSVYTHTPMYQKKEILDAIAISVLRDNLITYPFLPIMTFSEIVKFCADSGSNDWRYTDSNPQRRKNFVKETAGALLEISSWEDVNSANSDIVLDFNRYVKWFAFNRYQSRGMRFGEQGFVNLIRNYNTFRRNEDNYNASVLREGFADKEAPFRSQNPNTEHWQSFPYFNSLFDEDGDLYGPSGGMLGAHIVGSPYNMKAVDRRKEDLDRLAIVKNQRENLTVDFLDFSQLLRYVKEVNEHANDFMKYRETQEFITSAYSEVAITFRYIMFLIKFIKDNPDLFDTTEVIRNAVTSGAQEEKEFLPWNYKIFRNHHVLSSGENLIANNLIATEAEMWSAVSLKVPSSTIENLNGFLPDFLNWGITEDVKSGGSFKIDSDQDFSIWPNDDGGGVNYLGRYPGPKDTLENFIEVNATTTNLAQMVFKHRLAQGMSKMYRGSLICLGKNIKPYDQIQIIDEQNEMVGKVMAERVIQNFSVSRGWTTTVVPCGLTRVNSKMASYNISTADRLTYFLSKGRTVKYIWNTVLAVGIIMAFVGTGGVAPLLAAGGRAALGRAFGLNAIRTAYQAAGTAGTRSLAGIPKFIWNQMSTIVMPNIARQSGFGALGNSIMKTGSYIGASMGASTVYNGAFDVMHQVMNPYISQTVFLKDGEAVHIPCHMSLVYYNMTPFTAGIEDEYAALSNVAGWSEMLKDFSYWWREFTTWPRDIGASDLNKIEGV